MAAIAYRTTTFYRHGDAGTLLGVAMESAILADRTSLTFTEGLHNVAIARLLAGPNGRTLTELIASLTSRVYGAAT